MAQEIETDAHKQHPLYRSVWKTFLLNFFLGSFFDYHWYKNILHIERDNGSRLPHRLPLLIGAVTVALFYGFFFTKISTIILHQSNLLPTFEVLEPYAKVINLTIGCTVYGYKIYIAYCIWSIYTKNMNRFSTVFVFPLMVLFPVVYSQFRLNKWIENHEYRR